MLTVAFYSFRGGVGRTMALVNTAYQMAKAGLRVAVMDFDLEAPGLTLMKELQPSNPRSPRDKRGLMGYLLAGMRDPASVPKVEDLVYRARISDTKELRETKGAVYVLPAGDLKESAQGYDVSQLSFATLFEDKAHLKVIDDLKPGIEKKTGADYLLVDSRTGLTEIGGVCMAHLADHIVVLTGLNDQNIQGTAMVMKRLGEAREGIGERMTFVASPVPEGEEELKTERFCLARKVLAKALNLKKEESLHLLQIPYHPLLALRDRVYFSRYQDSPLNRAYMLLKDAIRSINQDDKYYLLEKANKASSSDLVTAMSLLYALYKSPGKIPVEEIEATRDDMIEKEMSRQGVFLKKMLEEAPEWFDPQRMLDIGLRSMQDDSKNLNNF